MSEFHTFAHAVQKQFELMSKGELFTVNISGNDLYEAYQAAFPAGTNDVFRKQREHECSTCRNFIKNIGNVVSINDDLSVENVWNCNTPEFDLPEPYNIVAQRMADLVKSLAINGLFRAEEPAYGGKPNKDNESDIMWNHFYGVLNRNHYVNKKTAIVSASSMVGKYATDVGVFKRGLEELKLDAIETVSDLILSNNLYRGQEQNTVIGGMFGLRKQYDQLSTDQQRNAFVYKNLRKPGSMVRNTAIGTLLIDLSEGVELEHAVKSYEDKVSGTNYKRPTALITPRMVQDAMKTIHDLGIEDSLHRRLATIEDVAVTDVLYVDNDVRSKMKGGIANLLMDAAIDTRVVRATFTPQSITIDSFMKDILPNTKKLELLVSNNHQSNFMVLTAPQYPGTENIFKWNNSFGWSYDGNITDTIKEKVKLAGGITDAPLRVSLAWFNHDDLDLHAIEPSGNHICFHQYRKGRTPAISQNGGQLDVDMNAGGGTTRTPVENIVWNRVTDGKYKVIVNNYSQRETRDTGYTIEVECNGVVQHFSSQTSPRSGQDITAIELTVKGGKIAEIIMNKGIVGTSFSQEKWGVKTEQFTRVDSVMLSPNHWGSNAVGNKHYFFVLEGCKSDVPARGIYNEFLTPEFDKHRKVFEVLGNKMMCEPTDNQMAGVGFSSTKKDKVTIRVNGHQLYDVQF
jgi:hypothetical protein